MNALQKLLIVVRKSSSKLLLSYACEILVTTNHKTDTIKLELYLKSYLRQLDQGNQIKTLQAMFNMCATGSDTISPMQRYHLTKYVMAILLRHCLYGAFETFYMSNLLNVLEVLNEKLPTELADKTVMFVLIQSFFGRIKISAVENNLAPFNTVIAEDNPRLLLRKISECALQALKEDSQSGNYYRIYKCEAYNALASAICSTQKDEDRFKALFGLKVNNKNILWEMLVDLKKIHKFVVDFDMVPQRKKVLINIRSSMRRQKKKLIPGNHTVQYIESQNLFNSSLSEDITKYDFTNTALRSQLPAEDAAEELDSNAEIEISLESISINEHECIGTICGVIQHLADSRISPLPEDDEEVKLPKWMEMIRKALESDDAHRNVKIFLTNLIYNCKDIFKHYAYWFVAPIMKIIVDGHFGADMNFFVIDLVSKIQLFIP